jgi:hypothetical protein
MLTSLRACTRLVVGRPGFISFVAIAMAALPGAAFAAPLNAASSGLVVAQSAMCRVEFVAVSYDDPGADDGEFLELHVDMLGVDSSLGQAGAAGANGEACRSSDAGSSADAAAFSGDARDAAGPVLGDCGLGELELVDGASAGCETYRAIPLSTVPIPPDGYVVLCPAGSSIDSRAHCDVTAAGRSALRAGWLQNGPNDGLRFTDTEGGVALEVGYEGGPTCFDAAAALLEPESGGTATSDDVNAVCGGAFTLLPEEEAPLREPVRCPGRGVNGVMGIAVNADGAIATGARDGEGGPNAGVDGGSDAAPWVPERAPAPASRGTVPAYGPLYVDAGIPLLGRPAPAFPRPPACTVGLARRTPTGVGLVLACCLLLTRRRRRGRPGSALLPELRANCAAHCGCRPPRSPSR